MSTDTASVEALANEIEDACLLTALSRRDHLDSRIDAAAMLRSLAAERDEDQAVIAVWRGRTERAEAERDALARRVAELEADGIHSCHPECERPVCVLVRERDALLAKVAEQEATLALQQASYERELALDGGERDRLRAALDRWEATLSAVMPADFKDWHANSRAEWPEIAAWVITNLREREAEAWRHVDRLTAAAQAPREAPRLTDEIAYPRDLFADLIAGNSPYAFYLFQWVPYQTEAKRWRLKMLHDVKTFDGREAMGIWPNGSHCGPFRDDEVEFIRISRKQWTGEWIDPRPARA